jgi:hypothetical protein
VPDISKPVIDDDKKVSEDPAGQKDKKPVDGKTPAGKSAKPEKPEKSDRDVKSVADLEKKKAGPKPKDDKTKLKNKPGNKT